MATTKSGLALLIACLLAGCATITIHPEKSRKLAPPPTYQDTRHFFFWGLAGETRVDVREVCAGRDVAQMQSQATFVNALLTIITLGIYAPHTVKVWCK